MQNPSLLRDFSFLYGKTEKKLQGVLHLFGRLGTGELILIFSLALVVFGPKRLPEIGRSLGRGLLDFRKAMTDLPEETEEKP